MKKSIFKPVVALAGAAVLLASCSDVYTGGDVSGASGSFTAGVTKESVAQEAATLAGQNFSVIGGNSIAKASSESVIALSILSSARLNKSTIDSAISFYSLKANTVNEDYYPMHDATLSKSLKTIEDGTQNEYVKTVVVYTVNTSAVTTNKIAVVCDATVLKDVNGYFALNTDTNLTAGEETDSVVKYITVDATADGSTTTALANVHEEAFNPTVLDAVLDSDNFTPAQNTDGTITVTTGSASDVIGGYFTSLASGLNSLYYVEYAEAGSTSYTKDSKFAFAYDETSHTYKATSSVLSAGRHWRLVTTTATVKESDVSSKLYGHPTVFYATTETEYGTESDGSAGIGSYFASEPSYIVSASATTFPDSFDYNTITSAQKGLLTVTSSGEGKYKVVLGKLSTTQLEFANASDFIVIDEITDSDGEVSYSKVAASVTQKDEKTVFIQLDRPYYTGKGTLSVWVGNGTAVKENPVNAAQTTFGVYKAVEYGAASGYVKISN